MAKDPLLRDAVRAIKAKIESAAASATPEELAYLGTAIDRIGGRATLLELEALGDAKMAEIAAQASAAETAVAQIVAAKMTQIDGKIDGKIDSFIDRWGVNGYTVLEVGTGKRYAAIADAWRDLVGKAIKADILIKVSDGDYPMTGLWLEHQPFGTRIRIEGNVDNPQNCILRMVPGDGGFSHGVVLSRGNLAGFSGFTILGSQTEQHWTHSGLRVEKGAHLQSNSASLRFERCGVVVRGGFLEAEKLIVNACRAASILATEGGTVLVSGAKITGASRTAAATTPEDKNKAHPFFSIGLRATDGSRIFAGDATISTVKLGAITEQLSCIWCNGAQVEDAETGFFSQFDGQLLSYTQAIARNVTTGFGAQNGGQILAMGALAEKVDIGFFATTGGRIFANYSACVDAKSWSYFAEWGGTIFCHENRGGATPTKYNLSNGVPGNRNATIYY